MRAKEFLKELNMAPGKLMQFAQSPLAANIRAGFEAELIVPGTFRDGESGAEADWDMDERIQPRTGLDDIAQFFQVDERDYYIRQLENDFSEWFEDQATKHCEEELDERIQYLTDKFIEDNPEDDPEDAEETIREKAWDELHDEFMSDTSADYFDFFGDQGDRYYSDISNRYGFEWPYYKNTDTFSNSVEDLVPSLQKAIGADIEVFDDYHDQTKNFNSGNWYLEPDVSIDPPTDDMMGAELVSPPMPVMQMLDKMTQVFNWVEYVGGMTNKSTGLHVGVSINGLSTQNIDYVKLAIFLGDQYVLTRFGREFNTYTASAMNMVLRRTADDNSNETIANLQNMKQGLIDDVSKKIMNKNATKFMSINMKENYVEFRSMGGDYLRHPEVIRDTVLRYVRAYAVAANPQAERQEYAKKLSKLLNPSGDDRLSPFVRFAMGEIDKNRLVSTLAVRKAISQAHKAGLWTVSKDAISVQVTARNAEEAIRAAQQRNPEWKHYVDDAFQAKITGT